MQKEKDKQIRNNPIWSRRRITIVYATCCSAFVLLLLMVGLGLCTHGAIRDEYRTKGVSVDESFTIQLNQKLLQFDPKNISITPKIEGSWVIHRSLFGSDRIVFAHRNAFVAGTTYTVRFKKVERFSGIKTTIPQVVFTTEAAPGIASTSFLDTKVLAADSIFRVKLTEKNRKLRNLQLTIPGVELIRSEKNDDTYTWTPKGYLPQGMTVPITLKDTNSGRTLIAKSIPVATMPAVTQPVKENYFESDDKAIIVFATPIDQKSATIKFDLPGTGKWANAKTYEFTPMSVSPGKTYTYTLSKGLRSTDGGILTQDVVYHFSTPGNVTVVSMSPYGEELSQGQQTVRFTFDQAVDHTSAEAKFHLTRGTITAKTWQGNTLVVTATNFGFQETVNAWVDAGVVPVFGLPSARSYGLTFTTEIPVKRLNVPQYYQQYAQSCEASSVRMALAYRGINQTDMQILQKFGYHPHPYNAKDNVWDDPQLQFVGDVNGNQSEMTGWGVYAEPVASAVRSYGRGATVQYGVSTEFVANQIYAGNPVVLWGIWNDSAVQKSWKTSSGHTITGPIPMHVRLIVGVRGKASNPVGFYVNDPINGTLYWSAEELAYNVSRAGGANQAVAIQ